MVAMLVTIIVPVYNIIEYLRRCVDSITSQTYRELEIILVDDGSTDGSGALCDELAIADSRIRVIHQPNGGSSNARNHGIREARGEYIGFVDSDDYIDDCFVEKMMEAISTYNVKMAQISRDEIDENGNKRPDVCIPPTETIMITAHDQMRELLMHRGDCSFCTRLTHRSLFELDSKEQVLFPEGKLNEDFLLLIQMLPKVESYVILPQQAYHVFYRIGSNSRRKSAEDFSRVFSDIVDNADYAQELVAQDYPDLMEVAKRFALFQRLDYMLHIPISQMNKGNEFYQNVVRYLRSNFGAMISNKYLTGKNKVYLTLLTTMPVITRKVHKAIRL